MTGRLLSRDILMSRVTLLSSRGVTQTDDTDDDDDDMLLLVDTQSDE